MLCLSQQRCKVATKRCYILSSYSIFNAIKHVIITFQATLAPLPFSSSDILLIHAKHSLERMRLAVMRLKKDLLEIDAVLE